MSPLFCLIEHGVFAASYQIGELVSDDPPVYHVSRRFENHPTRYEQAAAYDPDRGIAQSFLEELDKLPASRR